MCLLVHWMNATQANGAIAPPSAALSHADPLSAPVDVSRPHHLWALSLPASLALILLLPGLLAVVLVVTRRRFRSPEWMRTTCDRAAPPDRRRRLFAIMYLPLRGGPMMAASYPFFMRSYDDAVRPRLAPLFYPHTPQLALGAMPAVYAAFCTVAIGFVVTEMSGLHDVSGLLAGFYVTVTVLLIAFEEARTPRPGHRPAPPAPSGCYSQPLPSRRRARLIQDGIPPAAGASWSVRD